MFNVKRIKWALRKTSLPVSKNALVLDVGSGGKPYPRSDVLLDRLTGAEHRCGKAMLIDGRPAVLGDALKMPFKDKAFDFVVASHILEHVESPSVFLSELQRVSKAGYIETPNALFERLFPYKIHCLEVLEVGNVLHIHKKKRPEEDSFLGSIDFLEKNEQWKKLFRSDPSLFHVRYFWSDKIKYKVHNPDESSEWIRKVNDEGDVGSTKSSYAEKKFSWRSMGLRMLSKWNMHLRVNRLKKFELISILACPSCKGELSENISGYSCGGCNKVYSVSPLPDFSDS